MVGIDMPVWPRDSPRALAVRRLLGRGLIGCGAAIVVLSALVTSGLLPLWRPSLPAPPSEVLASAPDSSPAEASPGVPPVGSGRELFGAASPSATPDGAAALAMRAETAAELSIAPWTPTAAPV